MKILRLSLWLIISPFILLILIIGSAWIYFQTIEPAIYHHRYAVNFDRECVHRADPVRFEINNILFEMPADDFTRGSLTQCWGLGWGTYRGCTSSQKEKTFKDEKGQITRGYCQSEDDHPFKITYTRLRNIDFILKTENMPQLPVHINEILIQHATKSTMKSYCEKPKSKIKFFNNPVSFECTRDTRPKEYNSGSKLCSFKGFIGDKIRIYLNERFVESELPKEYWPTYVSELEKIIKDYISNIPNKNFKDFCKKYE